MMKANDLKTRGYYVSFFLEIPKTRWTLWELLKKWWYNDLPVKIELTYHEASIVYLDKSLPNIQAMIWIDPQSERIEC